MMETGPKKEHLDPVEIDRTHGKPDQEDNSDTMNQVCSQGEALIARSP
uniref:Uncharacterized protein n=1 Tax=Tetranychus urticae TaxID=32264 RepID=T1KLS2_TETUR